MINKDTRLIVFITLSCIIPLFANAQSWDQMENDYNSFLKNKQNDIAVSKAKEMCSWTIKSEGDTSIYLPISLKLIGNAYKNSDSAIFYYDAALNILKKQKRTYHIESAKLHYNKAIIFKKVKKPNLSLQESENAIAILDKIGYTEYPFCIWPLINAGTIYRENQDYNSASKLFQKCLDLTGAYEGVSSNNYITTLYRLGNISWEASNYDTATVLLKKAILIEKSIESIDDSVKIKNVLLTAQLFEAKYFFKEALPLYFEVEDYIKTIYGVNNIEYYFILDRIGGVYRDFGNYIKAEDYYSKSNKILIQLNEDINGSNYAKYFINNGLNEFYRGNYKKAEINFIASLNIFKTIYGENDERYISSLNNLGGVYISIGYYDKAQYYFNKTLEINKNKFGENHLEYATSLHNLGIVYHNMGNDSLAIINASLSAEIRKKNSGVYNREYAQSLGSLGIIYLDESQFQLSERSFREAYNIYKKIIGESSPECASELFYLGLSYLFQGNYYKGKEYLENSFEINPSNIECEIALAKFYSRTQNFKDANLFYVSVFEKKLKEIGSNFTWLTQTEKEAIWNLDKYFYMDINNFSIKSFKEISYSTQISYNSNLISKSLLLETSRELDHTIPNSSDNLLKEQFSEMKQFRRLVNKMQSEGSDKKEIIQRYIQQADSLDKILVNKLGEYANAKRKFEITWKDVQANLSTSEAAIEFARYYDDQDTIYKYMALVVRPEFEYPKLVKLGSELKIKSSCSQREFSDLYNYVWSGIDSLLTGVKTVYYSPVGELNNVPFSALINDNNYQADSSKSNWSYLIDRYDLHQVTTTRYLADGTLKENDSIPLSINLVGGVNYSDLPLSKDSIEINETTEDLALQINLQNELNDSKTNRGGKLGYLKGSEIEVKQITKVLQDAGWLTTTISGRNAGEYQFKDELNLKSPGIIHIATHGFAFPEKEIKEEKNFQVQEKSNYKISEDPMVRCGLMFSGANISWSGDSKKMIETTGDDGILTAAEVANMDLSNTKLVVLSACETGLGKIESSEGTFGLKRGFKLAGVDQIIVSLWKVPDNETMELMTLFYSELAKTKDIDNSFNKAQKEMRNRYPYEPEKWAGFVLVR